MEGAANMIEGLSRHTNVRLRHAEAPLLKEREQYLEHLCARGIGRMGIRVTAAYLIHVIRVMAMSSLRVVTMEEIEQAGQLWAAYVGPERRSYHQGSPDAFVRVARLWLTFHRSLVLPPAQLYSEQIEQFSETLRSVQGLAPATVRGYSTKASFFLKWLDSTGGTLKSVHPSDVDEFLAIGRASNQSAAFIAAQCQALRSFFRYAEIRGWCDPDIPLGIRSPRVPTYKGPPRGPAWVDVRKLIRSAGGSTPRQLRAHAILLLLAIYGLRSSEVVQLRLSDFDWRNETFTVRRAKRGGLQQFPIQYEVGEAIIRYLQYGRKECTCRHLFVTLRPTHRPFALADMWTLVSRKMAEMGIESTHTGPHSLRHACATRLLKQGSSLQEIADFLGHRDINAVGIYARYDARLLRKVAAFSLAGLR
jgi:site-specific recombinase XerD